MRISKQPEERKCEIMDAAMSVFTEKGYSQATMRDIATAAGVVPGLCYRYFESKHKLFQSAVSWYVSDYCSPILGLLEEGGDDFDVLLDRAAKLFVGREGNEKYHRFFHRTENEEFNILMSCAICDYIQPYLQEYLTRLNAEGKIHISDAASLSRFTLYGQIPLINDESMSGMQRAERIKDYVRTLIELR